MPKQRESASGRIGGHPKPGRDRRGGGLAAQFVRAQAMPEKAAVDALHVATAVVNGMDYVLTWNCTHIANAAIRDKIERTCRGAGFEPPIICTPEELMERSS